MHGTLEGLIGNTPLVKLTRYGTPHRAALYAKLEGFNPSGSVKDRTALAMIEDAEKRGKLGHGIPIIEPTSGNTGIAIAMLAAARGYRATIVMPDTMSEERRALLAAYGAEIILTDGKKGMRGAIARARELAEKGGILLGQFENPANPAVHYRTTGPEIWADLPQIDLFVAGVGTGGTLSGAGKFLREKNPAIGIVAVEPARSPVLSGGHAGPHKIQGIGAGFVPQTLDLSLIDEVIAVRDEDAFSAMRALCTTEGIFAGISSGAALWAAGVLARREENAGKTIAVLLPDRGDRYLSLLP